jgi:DNA primase
MRFASRMVINYDGDSAGMAAAARAVPLGFEKGLNVEVLVLPEDKDPDAFIRKNGRDRYLALQKKAVSGLKFLIDSLAKDVQMSIPEEKGRIVRAVVREIEKVPDAVARSEYLQRASQQLGIDENLIRSIVENRAPGKGQEEARLFCPAEKRLFQILMEDRSVAPYIFADCGEEIFQGLQSEPIFQYILDCFKRDQEWNFHELQGKVPAAILSQLAKALFEKSSVASIEEAQECLKSLRKVHLQNRLKDIQQKIAGSEKRGEQEELLALLYQKQDITKQILSMP